MNLLLNWLAVNKEWFFSGAGVLILSAIGFFFRNMKRKSGTEQAPAVAQNSNHQSVVVNNNIGTSGSEAKQGSDAAAPNRSLEERKRLTNILFIDNEDFKVVGILRKSGWVNIKAKKDIKALGDRSIVEAHICFVDIQDVATELFPKDQGLGLVGALKDRYPEKKIIVYSGQRTGDRFDQLLHKADARLVKDAEPYQFENLIDTFSKEVLR